MFDAVNFLKDNNIRYWTEGNNVTVGWVNIKCPFCSDTSNHCGINPNKKYVYCWKCGHHFLDELLSALLSIARIKTKEIIREYETIKILPSHNRKRVNNNKKILLPNGAKELEEKHRKYLIKRRFNPDKIIKEWKIKGTGPVGIFKHRIIIPIYYKNKLVSYQGRDITEQSSLRYLTCSPENEVVFHKKILYGLDNVRNRKAIVVEGVFDAWRFGFGAVATFGSTNTQKQILTAIKYIDDFYICFDPNDSLAQIKAEKLGLTISSLGKKVTVIDIGIDGDPADLSENEAKYIKKSLLKE